MQGKGKGKGSGKSSSTFVASSYPAYPFASSASATTMQPNTAASSSAQSSSSQSATRPSNVTAFTFLASQAKVQRSDEPATSTITFSDGRPSLKLFFEEGRDDVDRQLFFSVVHQTP